MQQPTLSDLQDLTARLVLPFYQVNRDTTLPMQPRRFENDAEHSWSLALLACSLAPQIDASLDVGKIAQFAIVHDLVEVFAGDTSPWHDQQTRETKVEREEQALRHIAAEFAHFPWITETIIAYETHASAEARFVWALDKVVVLIMRYLDKGRHYVENGITKQLFEQRLVAHRQKAHAHPQVGEYYDQLLSLFASHPEFFAPEK